MCVHVSEWVRVPMRVPTNPVVQIGLPPTSRGGGERVPEQPAENREEPSVTNRVSGEAQVNGPVIQTGAFHGDVTVYHGDTADMAQPAEPVLTSVEYFLTGTTVYQWDGSEDMWLPGPGMRVLVEAVSRQAVVLKGMRPVVVSRKSPRPAHVHSHLRAALEVRGFMTDLDADVPVLVPRADTVADFPFTVTSSDPELFEVSPSSSFDVEWRLELDWTSAGRSGTTVIDREGRPLRCLPEPHEKDRPARGSRRGPFGGRRALRARRGRA